MMVKRYESVGSAGGLCVREGGERSRIGWQVMAQWRKKEKTGWKQARVVVCSLVKKKSDAQETNVPSQHCITPNRLYLSITSCPDAQQTVCDTFHIYINSANLSLQ